MMLQISLITTSDLANTTCCGVLQARKVNYRSKPKRWKTAEQLALGNLLVRSAISISENHFNHDLSIAGTILLTTVLKSTLVYFTSGTVTSE